MTDEVKILTSKDAIPMNTSPTGVKYGAFREGEAPLWEVFAIRYDEENKELPDRKASKLIEGKFTSDAKANEAIRRSLSLLWAASDKKAEQLAARKVA